MANEHITWLEWDDKGYFKVRGEARENGVVELVLGSYPTYTRLVLSRIHAYALGEAITAVLGKLAVLEEERKCPHGNPPDDGVCLECTASIER